MEIYTIPLFSQPMLCNPDYLVANMFSRYLGVVRIIYEEKDRDREQTSIVSARSSFAPLQMPPLSGMFCYEVIPCRALIIQAQHRFLQARCFDGRNIKLRLKRNICQSLINSNVLALFPVLEIVALKGQYRGPISLDPKIRPLLPIQQARTFIPHNIVSQ